MTVVWERRRRIPAPTGKPGPATRVSVADLHHVFHCMLRPPAANAYFSEDQKYPTCNHARTRAPTLVHISGLVSHERVRTRKLRSNTFAHSRAPLLERHRLVAEAWRTVDKLYVDRTFNGHDDWFRMRQGRLVRARALPRVDSQTARDTRGWAGMHARVHTHTHTHTPGRYLHNQI